MDLHNNVIAINILQQHLLILTITTYLNEVNRIDIFNFLLSGP